MNDELYPIDQVDWNHEQTLFKQIMREVVYHTFGIYFDGVKDTADEQAVMCQLWTQRAGADDEWMYWYSIDKVSLRQIATETLVAMATKDACDLRDGKNSPSGQKAP